MKNRIIKISNVKRISFLSNLLLVVCFSICIAACCKKDDGLPVSNAEISQEIKDLIFFRGEESASTVIINAQSGPDNILSRDVVDLIFSTVDTTDLLAINVHQAQTLNPAILDGGDLTLDQAVAYNSESIRLLDKVVKYFKDQDKTVYVLGASFGAFVVQELIAKKGIDVADKYLIMIGRLDINEVMWQGLVEGRFGYFENGITPVLDQDQAMDLLDRNLGKISAGLGMNRYTQELDAFEDLSNMTYVYGATDHFVGSLTPGEIAFLESKNANVISSSGGHDDTFLEYFGQGLKEGFGIE